jgi:Xaa-Pro aminopeptidase
MDFPEYYQTLLTPAAEIGRRIAALQKKLPELEVEAALIYQQADLFYFSGSAANGFLFVPAEGEPLFLVKKYLPRARAESPVKKIEPLPSASLLKETLGNWGVQPPPRLGLELDVLPVNTFRFLQQQLGWQEAVDVGPAIKQVRAVKSPFELDQMRRAGEIGRRVYAAIPAVLKPGLSEIDLAGILNERAMALGNLNLLRARGFNNQAFNWHVISGASGARLSGNDAPFAGLGLTPAFPVGAGLRTIDPGDPVLVDFGTCWNGYQVDQTRMFALWKPKPDIIRAYEALQEIEASILEAIRPGLPAEEPYRIARQRAEQLGYGESFLGPADQQVKYAGHGVGLEIDEMPFLAAGHRYPLEEGMTLALELKIVLPAGAVGFENTVAITGNGAVKLTPAEETFLMI